MVDFFGAAALQIRSIHCEPFNEAAPLNKALKAHKYFAR